MHNQKSPTSRGSREEAFFELNGEEYILLIKLLKIMRIAESGGQAKMMVDDGIVYLNGVQELRKRAKLRSGDVIEVMDYKIRIK